jgi:hypothetical protein
MIPSTELSSQMWFTAQILRQPRAACLPSTSLLAFAPYLLASHHPAKEDSKNKIGHTAEYSKEPLQPKARCFKHTALLTSASSLGAKPLSKSLKRVRTCASLSPNIAGTQQVRAFPFLFAVINTVLVLIS